VGYTGAQTAQDAEVYHRQLEVVKLSEAKKGLCAVTETLVVERSFAGPVGFATLLVLMNSWRDTSSLVLLGIYHDHELSDSRHLPLLADA
jgi:hypothetical protein